MRKGIINEVGEKEKKLKELKEDVDDLKEEIKSEIKVGEVVTESKYSAEMRERVTTEYSPTKVKKAVKDDKKFLDVIKVKNTALNKILSKDEMDKCIGDTYTSEVLKIKKVKPKKSIGKQTNGKKRNIILDK